jgi:hypothetical protein
MLSKLSQFTTVSAVVFQAVALSAAPNSHWVVSWGASPSPAPLDASSLRDDGLDFNNQTVRQIVHLSLGGSTVRVRFSNLYGKQKVSIASAHVALQKKDSEIAAGSDRPLTFAGGARTVTIPANSYVVSDPVKLSVAAGSNLAITVFLPGATPAAGIHYSAQQISYTG